MSGYRILGMSVEDPPKYARCDGTLTTEDDPQRLVTREDVRRQGRWTVVASVFGALVGSILVRLIYVRRKSS